MEYKIRSLDLGLSDHCVISSMNVGKSFKVFQSKVHPNQTKAHLKGLINQESEPIKLFSAELPEPTLPFQIYQHIT